MQVNNLKVCAVILVLGVGFGRARGQGLDLGNLDPALIQQGMQMLQSMTPEQRSAAMGAAKELLAQGQGVGGLSVDKEALEKGMKYIQDALCITANAEARRLKHEAELAAKGIAEVPASTEAVRYSVDTHGLGDLLFDDWGELYIDRRFLTDAEMKRVKEIEAFAWKHLIEPLRSAKILPSKGSVPSKTVGSVPGKTPETKGSVPAEVGGVTGKTAGSVPTGTKPVKRAPRVHAGGAGLPVFRGFEDARYQQYDELIARMVADFNKNKAKWCGGNPDQAAKIADVTAAMVKSHMIEETGGNGPRSKAAWAVDPLQINVPGDWGPEKESLGLKKPAKRNEGTAEQNVRAAIMYLSRKGFGSSGKPAAVRPKGFFDGWPTALTRYNGRRDRTDTDRYYSEEYSDKIVKRAANPDLFVPIEIKLATKK